MFNIGIFVHINKLLVVKLEVCIVNTIIEFVNCKTGNVQWPKCWLAAFTKKWFNCAYCLLWLYGLLSCHKRNNMHVQQHTRSWPNFGQKTWSEETIRGI